MCHLPSAAKAQNSAFCESQCSSRWYGSWRREIQLEAEGARQRVGPETKDPRGRKGPVESDHIPRRMPPDQLVEAAGGVGVAEGDALDLAAGGFGQAVAQDGDHLADG